MTSDGKSNGAGEERGIERHAATVITLTFDHDTCVVSYDAHGAKIGLVQMILDEASRQLEIVRRQAAAMEMQKQIREAVTNAALAESIFGVSGKKG